jgi:hypothetical protein
MSFSSLPLEDVDARDKPEHDDLWQNRPFHWLLFESDSYRRCARPHSVK